MRTHRRIAFTVVEMLAVAAIIGTLIALTLPAIQAARESARCAHCKNNLKQLSLAALNHLDVHGHFPTGGWGWYWVGDPDRGFGKDQPGGWFYNILPFCEESAALHDLAADGQPNDLTRVQRVGSAQVIQSPLAIVNCPTRRRNALYPLVANEGGDIGFFNSITPSFAGRSDYAANAGHVYCEWPHGGLGRGPTSYVDAELWSEMQIWGGEQPGLRVATSASAPAMTGVSFERSIVRASHVVDGLSKAYLVAEKFVPQRDYETGRDLGDNETWCTGFNNDNFRKTGRLENDQIQECAPAPDWDPIVVDPNGRFGAAHPSGWNAAFCDGSVHTIPFTVDWRVHRDLGNRMDGGAVELPN